MDFFSLSDEERAIRDTVRSFVVKEILPLEDTVLRRERAHEPGLQLEELRELQQKARKFGFWGLATPEEYGGMGLPAVVQSLIWTELGRTIVPFRFGGEADNILFYANDAQKEEFLLPTIEAPGSRASRSPSRARARTRRTSRCPRGRTATTGSSTARRRSSRTATRPTSRSWSR